MNAFEYALHNFEDPSLAVALNICKNRDEMTLLTDCLMSKRGYHISIRSVSTASNDEERDYWIASAEKWSGWFLDELKQLEAMQ